MVVVVLLSYQIPQARLFVDFTDFAKAPREGGKNKKTKNPHTGTSGWGLLLSLSIGWTLDVPAD